MGAGQAFTPTLSQLKSQIHSNSQRAS